jgi:hypothetical protein
MNKFDALKQFQSWPREWQELCSEYWVEAGEPVTGIALPMPNEPFPFDQSKAAPKVAVKTRRSSKHSWSAAESEFLLKLIDEETDSLRIAERFVERYSNRSIDAVRRRAFGIKIGEIPREVKY